MEIRNRKSENKSRQEYPSGVSGASRHYEWGLKQKRLGRARAQFLTGILYHSGNACRVEELEAEESQTRSLKTEGCRTRLRHPKLSNYFKGVPPTQSHHRVNRSYNLFDMISYGCKIVPAYRPWISWGCLLKVTLVGNRVSTSHNERQLGLQTFCLVCFCRRSCT